MRAIPNTNAALFDEGREATPVLRGALPGVPSGALLDDNGCATPIFRSYLSGIMTQPVPVNSEPLADADGRATRVFTRLLMGLPT